METLPAKAGCPALQMEGVTVVSMAQPRIVVAEDVNWTVNVGDYWLVAGLQGSGKSDFLMLAGGLMAPESGSYQFLGKPMPIFEDARLRDRLRLGFVFDGGQLLSRLTVRENIALPLRYHQQRTEAEIEGTIDRLLEALDLGAWADHLPSGLARNWQKRAGLARALALQPEVLLVDNPLGGLDLRHTNWWVDFLGQLSRGHALLEGRAVTLVITAADLRPWRGHARQFALLNERRLRVLGAWAELEAAGGEALRELLTEETPSG